MESVSNNSEDTQVTGPGARLAAARESAGMTLEQVAERLHLSQRQIAALEANRYDDLPETPYVRGYIRNYAILLGLDDSELVDAFNAVVGARKKTVARQQQAAEALKVRSTPNITIDSSKLVAAGIVVVLVVAALVWILGSGKEGRVVQPTASSQITDQHFAQQQQSIVVDDTVQQQASLPGQTEASEIQTESTVKTTDTGSVDTATSSLSAADQIPQTAPETAPETATMETPSQPADRSMSQIVLYVEVDSWADVRDAGGNKLIYETVAGGRVITLQGRAPLKVFLGNAAAVKLFYNGKEFDFSQYKRGLVARFSLQ